jgi:hypothetical protein
MRLRRSSGRFLNSSEANSRKWSRRNTSHPEVREPRKSFVPLDEKFPLPRLEIERCEWEIPINQCKVRQTRPQKDWKRENLRPLDRTPRWLDENGEAVSSLGEFHLDNGSLGLSFPPSSCVVKPHPAAPGRSVGPTHARKSMSPSDTRAPHVPPLLTMISETPTSTFQASTVEVGVKRRSRQQLKSCQWCPLLDKKKQLEELLVNAKLDVVDMKRRPPKLCWASFERRLEINRKQRFPTQHPLSPVLNRQQRKIISTRASYFILMEGAATRSVQ